MQNNSLKAQQPKEKTVGGVGVDAPLSPAVNFAR